MQTTERPGELLLTLTDGQQEVLYTFLWDVEALDEVDGQLRVSGTEFGMRTALTRSVDALRGDGEFLVVPIPG